MDDLYKKYNIDKNKLIRDYIKNPLRHIESELGKPLELPYKQDLEYMYIELNLTRNVLCNILNISPTTFKKIIKKLGIKKERNKIHENVIKGTLENYGVENYTQTKEWHDLILKQNNGLYPTQTDEFKRKSEETKELKYGNKHYNNIDKIKKTCLEKYGVEFYTQTDEYKQNYINIFFWVKRISRAII